MFLLHKIAMIGFLIMENKLKCLNRLIFYRRLIFFILLRIQ